MIIKLLTSLVTRDAEVFVNFIEHLRDKLDALVIKHAGDIGKLQAYIDELAEQAHEEAQHIEARLVAEKQALEDQADAAIADVNGFFRSETAKAEAEIASIKAKVERVKNAATAVAAI